ncbi:MAG: dimethylsulfonioproprionate lyase family protein, partial [Aestuariivirga sp.]
MQNSTAETALRTLVAEIETYVSGLKGPGISSVLEGINKWARGPVGQIKSRSLPACDHLGPALHAMRKPSLAKAIADARPFLHWVSYDAYPREDIGAAFADNHAFASIIGAGCPIE